MDCESAALAEGAFHGDITAMGLGNVFDNGQPQARAAHGAAAGLVHPVEPLEQPRQMLPLSLSYDHRLIDGAEAARFLRWLCEALENPLLTMFKGGK